jgi:hypothetical protein
VREAGYKTSKVMTSISGLLQAGWEITSFSSFGTKIDENTGLVSEQEWKVVWRRDK